MRSSGYVWRLAPSLCILATVSFPGQAQTAPDDQGHDARARNRPVAIVQPGSDDDASTEIRAPMLAPEDAGEGELELIEPQPAGRRWRTSTTSATAPDLAGAESRNGQALPVNSVAALSAVPSAAAPPESPQSRTSLGDLSEKWPLYGLIASLVLAAAFLFWRLGERARVSDYDLIGYTAASPDDEAAIATNAGELPPSPDGQAEPSTYESLHDAVRAMKAARRPRG